MSRSLGPQLPDRLREFLNGRDLAQHEGLTFQLVTCEADGWPRIALLSVGEIVAVDARTLRAGLWLHSRTARSLAETGRALLALVVDGSGYSIRASARRGRDLDLGADGRLAYFVLQVDDVLQDTAEYATITSGITFRLNQPEQVIPRWQHTVDALRAAAA